MSRDLMRRVGSLEGTGPRAAIGEVMAMQQREEAGETVDWSAVRLDPDMLRSLDALSRK